MKDPTKVKTPEATGAELVDRETGEIIPAQVPYSELDKLDEQAIISSYDGQPFRSMIYSLPFKDGKGKAPKDCGIPGCAYDGKYPHTHATGVGIKGINEIVRQMGGIMVEIVEAKIVKHNGKPAFWAKAVARDQFTLTERFGENICPRYDRYGNENRFYIDIAKSKAERNAAKKIIPQLILDGLEKLAESGKDVFEESDIEQLFRPFWTDRARLKAAWFEKMTDRALEGGVKIALPSAQRPAQEQEALPEGQNSGEAENDDSGGFPGNSKQKYSLASKIQKGAGCTKDQALEFIAAKMTTYETMQDYFAAFNEGNFDDVSAWLEQQGRENE
jgi:hypothetical protein